MNWKSVTSWNDFVDQVKAEANELSEGDLDSISILLELAKRYVDEAHCNRVSDRRLEFLGYREMPRPDIFKGQRFNTSEVAPEISDSTFTLDQNSEKRS